MKETVNATAQLIDIAESGCLSQRGTPRSVAHGLTPVAAAQALIGLVPPITTCAPSLSARPSGPLRTTIVAFFPQ